MTVPREGSLHTIPFPHQPPPPPLTKIIRTANTASLGLEWKPMLRNDESNSRKQERAISTGFCRADRKNMARKSPVVEMSAKCDQGM